MKYSFVVLRQLWLYWKYLTNII